MLQDRAGLQSFWILCRLPYLLGFQSFAQLLPGIGPAWHNTTLLDTTFATYKCMTGSGQFVSRDNHACDVSVNIFSTVSQYKRSGQPLQVVIHDLQIVPASSDGSQAAVVASATAVAPQRPAALRKGDKHSCVLQVQADAVGQDLPLGHLQIVWARAGYGCCLCRVQNAVMRLMLVDTFCLC